MTVNQDSITQAVKLLESHVHSSSPINGIKALHLSQECVDSYDNWDLIVSDLTSKGYDVRGSKFKSGNRLGHGEYVGVEISFKPPMEGM